LYPILSLIACILIPVGFIGFIISSVDKSNRNIRNRNVDNFVDKYKREKPPRLRSRSSY
jgi:hypothetical protein